MRPFVLRRTKGEVAKDLPERSEEDLLCEMEGRQATLYRAELKRARQELLKIKTAKELDNQRFHILTSLLRLDPTWLFGLQEAQVLGTLYTLAGAAGLVLLLRRSRLRSA